MPLLVFVAQFPPVVRDGLSVAGGRGFGCATAHVAALLLFDLAPQLQLDLLEPPDQAGVDALRQGRIVAKFLRIHALHFAHQVLNITRDVRILSDAFTQPAEIADGFAIRLFGPRRIPTIAVGAPVAARTAPCAASSSVPVTTATLLPATLLAASLLALPLLALPLLALPLLALPLLPLALLTARLLTLSLSLALTLALLLALTLLPLTLLALALLLASLIALTGLLSSLAARHVASQFFHSPPNGLGLIELILDTRSVALALNPGRFDFLHPIA